MKNPTDPCAPISVIIPAFNDERYVAKAVASVRAQTLAPAEIIVVDDGSSDGTAAAAVVAGANVLRQDNRGTAAARNAGVAVAGQPWIALLDADDRWLPEKLERQWKAHLAAPDVKIIGTDLILVSERGVREPSAQAIHRAYGRTVRLPVSPDAVRIASDSVGATLPLGHYLCNSSALIERALLLEEPFDPDLPRTPLYDVAEEFEWLLRAIRHSDLLMVEVPLVEYLMRSDSQSANVGRVRYGDVKLGEMVNRSPHGYVAQAAPAFRALRAHQLRIAAVEFLRSGQASKARAVVREAAGESFDPRLAGLGVAAALLDNSAGAVMVRNLRALRRAARS